MIYYEQLSRALAYDWTHTTEIAGSRNAVATARRILSFLVSHINPTAFERNRAIAPRQITVSIKDICETLDIPRPTVNRAMKRLQDNGQIKRYYTGYYELNLCDCEAVS